MTFNKDIIIHVTLGIAVVFAFIKVVGPAIFDMLKGKIPGSSNPENDIDSMIRRQKERLRAQYGLIEKSGPASPHEPLQIAAATRPNLPSKEISDLYKETRWGGGDFTKRVQNEIAKNYSYTLAESKVNAFILLAEKRRYVRFLSHENQKSLEAIQHYLSMVMLFLILIDEIRNKEFNLIDKVAKKSHLQSMEFLLALQLKILFSVATKKSIKEERLFESVPTLHQYSEETMNEAIDIILGKEANLWAKGHSTFFEELSLYLSYADFLLPMPVFQNKKDLKTAYLVLKTDSEAELDEVKKLYKKLTLIYHPDKIGQMKLPKILEKKALAKFTHIQEAYDIIATEKKKSL